MLDARDAVSYPDAVERGGDLYICYDRDRGAYQSSVEAAERCAREILFAKVTEDDIRAGKLVSPDSSLRNIISKLGHCVEDMSVYFR